MFEDLKNISKHKLLMFLIVMIALIPAIYSVFFLDSMWKPYETIKKLPVAIINEDIGYKNKEKEINIGADLVEKLKEKKTLDFSFLEDKNEALEGLESGKYYMILEINKKFSENASKILDKTPLQMKLDYTTNPGLNYISTKITNTALRDIQKEVVKTVQNTYIKTLFENMNKIGKGYIALSEGSKQLNEGTQKILSGQKDFGKGLSEFGIGTEKLYNGAYKLNDGIKQYTDGIKSVADGSNKLKTNSGNVILGKDKLFNSIGTGIDKLNVGSDKLMSGVEGLSKALPKKENIYEFNQGLNKFAVGLNQTYEGTKIISTHIKEVNEGMTKLDTGLNKFITSINGALSQKDELLQKILSFIPQEKRQEAMGTLGAYLSNFKLDELQNMSKIILESSNKLKDGTTKLVGNDKSGILAVENGLNNLDKSYSNKILPTQIQFNEGYNKLNYEINKENGLLQGLKASNKGFLDLKNGLTLGKQKLDTGLQTYMAGVDKLDTGLQKLNDKSSDLTDGGDKLTEGSKSLYDGNNKLINGNLDLQVGVGKLDTATKKIYDKIKEASDKMVDNNFDKKNVETLVEPIEINRKEISVIVNNGHAMAPYMMTISLFVGALAVCIAYPITRNKENIKNVISWWCSKFSILLIFAILQSVILVLSLLLLLGFSPEYRLEVFVMSFMASLTFLSIIAFLIINYGIVGKFLTILLLVLQLATSEGTYPLVLSRGIYKTISPFLPATYAIKGLKEAISINGDISKYAWVLFFITVGINIVNMISIYLLKNGKLLHRKKIQSHIEKHIN